MSNDFVKEDICIIEQFEFDNSFVTLYGPKKCVKLLGEDFYAAEGTWFEKCDDGTYTPDWDLTWFWKVGNCPEDYFYYEQDSFEVSLHNLKNIING